MVMEVGGGGLVKMASPATGKYFFNLPEQTSKTCDVHNLGCQNCCLDLHYYLKSSLDQRWGGGRTTPATIARIFLAC